MPLTQVDQGLLGQYAQYTGFKNRIINGAMMIDQRNAGAAQNNLSSGWVYTVDRWEVYSNNSSRFSTQQNRGSVTPPAGFKNYLGVVVNTGYSVGASDYNILAQPIEGFNTADLGFGASGASPVNVSFWVYSSVTGTHSGFLGNNTLVTAYPFTFSVPVANTWTQISVAISGSTSGSWIGATNGIGLFVGFNLGNGSNFQTASPNAWNSSAFIQPSTAVSVVSTTGATFYITGVQLEKGSTATSFDYRPYGTELALCQRYLPVYVASAANELICYAQGASTTVFRAIIPFQVTTRVKSTGITVSSTSDFFVNGNVNTTPSAMVWNDGTLNSGAVQITGSGMTAGFSCVLYSNTSTAKIIFTGCEL